MDQVAEHILGKDEVTSSNLVISSTDTPEIRRFQVFSFAFRNFFGVFLKMLIWVRPHNKPQTEKFALWSSFAPEGCLAVS